jgi:ubiquinone/menaquinone biosynthesis C-methylase UbiE
MPEATTDRWAERAVAWHTRVEKMGVDRAIFHKKHKTPEQLAGITRVQQDAIWPHLLAARNGTERRALDFGCGIGRWTPALANLIGSALGVDPTPELLAYAEAHRPSTTGVLDYALYDRGHIPAEDKAFDVLWVCMVLSTVLDEQMFQATLIELRRVLQPGALIVLTDNTSREDGRPIRSGDSMSRTVKEYQRAFRWADLRRVGQYIDWHEINTVFVGRVYGDREH